MKTLLATVAVGALVGTAGIAQETADDSAIYSVSEGDHYASNLLGSRLFTTESEVGEDVDYSSVSAEWNDVGEINDVVVGEDGTVRAVIVGVGGFLGIGEKDVAISWEDVSPTYDDDGSRFLVVSMSQEALETAPAFEYQDTDAAMAEGEPAAEEAAAPEMAEGEPVAEEADAEAMAEADVTEAPEEAAQEVEVAEGEAEAPSTEMADAEATDEMAAAEGEDVAAAEGAEGLGMAADPMAVPEGFELVEVDMLTAEELEGATVRSATNEEWVGEVASLVLDDQGKINEAVIDVGGFLGIGEKPVAMGFEALEIYRQGEGGPLEIRVNSTREELEGMESFQPDEG